MSMPLADLGGRHLVTCPLKINSSDTDNVLDVMPYEISVCQILLFKLALNITKASILFNIISNRSKEGT